MMDSIKRLANSRGGLAAIALLLITLAGTGQADPGEGVAQRLEALEAQLGDLGATGATLNARVDALEAYIRKLHRNAAAVIKIDTGGSSGGGYDSVGVFLEFCTLDEYNANTQDCPANLRDLSVSLANGDSGTSVTWSAANDPDFEAIVALLTNGERDIVKFRRQIGNGGGANSSSEASYFKEFLPSDGIDLVGYNVGSITLVVDFFSIFDDGSYLLQGRLYFEFAD